MACAESPLTARTRESGVHLCARRIEATTPRPNPAPQQANAWARPRTGWQKRTPHACSSTRTRHRPGAPSDKGRRTRRSRCLRGSESGDSLWLLEVDKGVVSCASCGFGVAGRRHSPPLPTAPPDLHELENSRVQTTTKKRAASQRPGQASHLWFSFGIERETTTKKRPVLQTSGLKALEPS